MADNDEAALLVAQLRAILALAPAGDDAFHSRIVPGAAAMGYDRVFGGQVIAQALVAANATVPADRPVHSLHAYFLRMGAEREEIGYRVSRDLDGGTFSNRHVVATQGDRQLLTLSASFQRTEPGLSHQDRMPDVPPPETLECDGELRARFGHDYSERHRAALREKRPIELRTVGMERILAREKLPPLSHTWVRAVAPLGDNQALNRAVLAYMSDMVMMPTAAMPHGVSGMAGDILEASLDHAIWFHDDVRAEEWLLVETRSGWTGGARGFITARMFSRDGTLVASIAQEGLMRPLR